VLRSEANDQTGRAVFDRDIERLALLGDPVRRALYWHVVERGDYVSREDAAAALGIARALAAFHLDKLAGDALLEYTYRRPDGRRGPGAGRPAKMYRRSPLEVTISLPRRDYQLLAEWLAGALGQDVPADVRRRLEDVARQTGTDLAAEARRLAGWRPSRRRLIEAGLEVLRLRGFEPRSRDGDIALHSCPFQAVAFAHRNVVCPMNRSLMDGFIEGLKVQGVTVICEPSGDGCCVTLRLDS
jgi:predicted ArsR family transcriptional regulator